MKFLFTVIIPILVGVGLIASCFWLYLLAKSNDSYVLLFGLGTALLIPIGIALITYAFNFRNREMNSKLAQLSKVTEINDLLKEAKTQEEQLTILKKEYENLEITLRYNSEKMALELRKDQLISQSKDIYEELLEVDKRLGVIDSETNEDQLPKEVKLLRERTIKKNIVIIRVGSQSYSFDKKILSMYFPKILLVGPVIEILFTLLQLIENIQKRGLKERVAQIENSKTNEEKLD